MRSGISMFISGQSLPEITELFEEFDMAMAQPALELRLDWLDVILMNCGL